MKLPVFSRLLPVFLIGGPAAAGEMPIPQPWPIERYETFRQQSPFALATVTAAAAPPQAAFAANWFVSGIGRMGETDFVTIKSRDLSTQFSLFGQEPHAATGVVLASVDWSDTTGKSTVLVRRGTETARLEFNEAEMRGAPTSSTAGPRPQSGAAPGPALTAQTNPGNAPAPVVNRRARMISR